MFNIYHIILLKIEYWRVSNRRKVCEIHFVCLMLSPLNLPEHNHIFPLSVRGKITGHGDSIDNIHTVLVKLISTRLCDFPDNGHTRIDKFNGHNRILDKIAIFEFRFNVFSDFRTCKSSDVNITNYREINIPKLVDSVIGNMTFTRVR